MATRVKPVAYKTGEGSTLIKIAGVLFKVMRGTSDVTVFANDFEVKQPGKHAAKEVTDPSVIPGINNRSAIVYGALLEVPKNGKPVITTTGSVQDPWSTPLNHTFGDAAGRGWIYAGEAQSGTALVVKPLPGTSSYADLEAAAEAARQSGVPDAHIPTDKEILGLLFNDRSAPLRSARIKANRIGLDVRTGGAASTLWTASGKLFRAGKKTVFKLARQDMEENHKLTSFASKEGSKYAGFLIGTKKI